MNIRVAAETGWREIRANRLRSVLSFLAIAVGVGSILYTLAQTRGSDEALERTLRLMGPGRLTVETKRDTVSKGLSLGLRYEDALAVSRHIPGLYMVYPRANRWGATIYYGTRKLEDASVNGVTEAWRLRDWVYTLRGRFLNSWDVKTGARVCVVTEPGGWENKPFWAMFWDYEPPFEAFVKRHDLLGKTLRIEDHLFTVVGVIKQPPKDKDPRWFSWEDPSILVPITTYHRVFPGWGEKSATPIDEIRVDTGDEKTVPSVKRKLEALMRALHRGEVDFEVKDMREEIDNQLSETKAYALAATVLGLVAMLAGGIGIMNVTMATIFSRIKEVGIRRALGAGRGDILAQFVAEAMILGLAGGVAGIALGIGGIHYLRHPEQDLARMAWHHYPLVMLVAAAVAALFSAYPAYQASKLDPVEALRSD